MSQKPISKAVSESRQRTNTIRYLERQLKNYDKPEVTDDSIKAGFEKAIAWLKVAAQRNNAKPGGLGK